MLLRPLGLLAASLTFLAGCSMGSAIPDPQLAATTNAGPQPSPVRPATELALAAGTCWAGELLGSDPQLALKLAATFYVSYFDAAYALQDRPSFLDQQSCARDHAIEIYRLVPASAVLPQITDYALLMRPRTLEYLQLSAAVNQACMDPVLSAAASRSGVLGASVQPALPDGFRTSWTPATVEQWNRGQQVFACLFVQDDPSPMRYGSLRSADLPTRMRTCINSGSRRYVECARSHDRERIAVLDVSGAVANGLFPGRGALRQTTGGSYLDVDAAFYRPLDGACTAYLRAVSTDRRLSGVAEIDVRRWPDARGTYSVSCEADAPPGKPSKVTRGSVY